MEEVLTAVEAVGSGGGGGSPRLSDGSDGA